MTKPMPELSSAEAYILIHVLMQCLLPTSTFALTQPDQGTVRVKFSKYDVLKAEAHCRVPESGKMVREREDTFSLYELLLRI